MDNGPYCISCICNLEVCNATLESSSCNEVCNNSLVNFLLCDDVEGSSCLNVDDLLVTLYGGIAVVATLVFGILLLLFTVCGLGWKIKGTRKSKKKSLLAIQRNSICEGVELQKISSLDEVKNDEKLEGNELVCSEGLLDKDAVANAVTEPSLPGQDTEGKYEKLRHNNYNRPADIPTGSEVEQSSSTGGATVVTSVPIVTSAPVVTSVPVVSSVPALDDYSTISDIKAANSIASGINGGDIFNDEIPGYEEVKKSPVSLSSFGKSLDIISQDKNERTDSPIIGSQAGEVPLYSEVNLEVKMSMQAMDTETGTSDAAEKVEMGEDVSKVPLYSVVNLELKSSRQALDEIEPSQHGEKEDARGADDITLDDVINDFSRLAEGLPIATSPSPPPIPPPLDLSGSPFDL